MKAEKEISEHPRAIELADNIKCEFRNAASEIVKKTDGEVDYQSAFNVHLYKKLAELQIRIENLENQD